MSSTRSLAEAVDNGPPLLLDGSVGMELDARGFSTNRPGWSAAAVWEDPTLLEQIHADYVAAGADVITTNTFRMHARSLTSATQYDLATHVALAVELARSANPKFLVGSAGPLEDCYSPQATPDERTLEREHRAHAERLAHAGVDALLLETMPTFREAMAGLAAGVHVGLPTWVSFWCEGDGELGDGIHLSEAVDRVIDAGAAVVLVNCVPAADVLNCLQQFSKRPKAIGAYANTGRKTAGGWQQTAEAAPDVYADQVSKWIAAGCRLVGGCCGTSPAHIRAIRARIDSLTIVDRTP